MYIKEPFSEVSLGDGIMNKPYETFGSVENKFELNQPNSFFQLQKPKWTGLNSQGKQISAHKAFDDLKANLLRCCAQSNVKSILFNGICHGSGCSTTIFHFANSLTADSMCKVLLVELNLSLPFIHRENHHAGRPKISGFITDSKFLISQIEKIGPGNLHVISCGAKSLCGPAGLFDSSEIEHFIRSIYDEFDYIIFDAPPVQIYSEFRILCSKMDGVVLVIQSGNARRQVALRAKKEIEEAGGRILGIVINRRKYYIPNWIYNRL